MLWTFGASYRNWHWFVGPLFVSGSRCGSGMQVTQLCRQSGDPLLFTQFRVASVDKPHALQCQPRKEVHQKIENIFPCYFFFEAKHDVPDAESVWPKWGGSHKLRVWSSFYTGASTEIVSIDVQCAGIYGFCSTLVQSGWCTWMPNFLQLSASR